MDRNKQIIKDHIAVVPDFPKKGISFKDITPLFADPKIFELTIKELCNMVKDQKFDCIAGIESRGFWFALPMAQALNLPFVPIRKKGKLPRPTVQAEYSLEYGTDVLQVHKDDIHAGSNILVVDDIVATGGTLIAVKEMMKKLNAKCEHAVVLGHLGELKGALDKINEKGIKVHSLIEF